MLHKIQIYPESLDKKRANREEINEHFGQINIYTFLMSVDTMEGIYVDA